MVGAEADRSPFRKLLFRVDDLIGTVSQKKLLVNITGSAGDNELCAELLQERGRFKGTLEVIADRDDAGIKIADSQRGKEGLVCTVTDLCFCHIGKDCVDAFLRTVNGHDLMSEVVKMHGNMFSKTAEADQKN